MQITKVTAVVRYSQDSGKGAWKSLELGAEATVGPAEDWRQAQAHLYGELTQQVRALWRPVGKAGRQDTGHAGAEKSVTDTGENGQAPEPSQTPAQASRIAPQPTRVGQPSMTPAPPAHQSAASQKAPERSRMPVQPSQAAPTPAAPAHYCEEHEAPFEKHTKDSKTWYSHKTAEGRWCNEGGNRRGR